MELQRITSFEDEILPNIIGNNLVKKVLALQMFSIPSIGEKLHTLTVGDVASGKSTAAVELMQIVYGSTYTGKKITEVGLLEKIASSDGSIIYVDELDKIKKQVREQLLECMQTGTITYDKHQYHQSIPARINVSCFCNPRGYIINENMSVIDNLPFSLPLISRFHFFLTVKSLDPTFYGDYAMKKSGYEKEGDDKFTLKKYLVQVKEKVPRVAISNSIANDIGQYARMLKSYSSMNRIISPRLIEGLLSATRARARMNFREKATEEDWRYVEEIANEIYR